MGCCDSVYAKCPKCGRLVEFQSEARNCTLETFPTAKVPLSIAEDLDGTTRECRCCMRPVTLSIPKEVKTIAMEVS